MRPMPRNWLYLLAPLAFLLAALAARTNACCMAPQGYAGDVDQSMQEALIVHADGHQELVLRIRPFFRSSEEPPAFLAWLVTVPSKPSAYRTASPEIFGRARSLNRHLQDLYEEQKPKPVKMPLSTTWSVDDAARSSQREGLDVSAPVNVGPYTITEVRTRGPDAVAELNRYLADNEFGTEDPEHLRWFAENDFTFLCIRIDPPQGSVRLGTHLELDPLQIGFASPRPYYPGKYSANQGNFALALTVLTPQPLARESLTEVRTRLAGYGGRSNLFTVRNLPAPLQGVLEDGFGGAPPTPARWYVNRIYSSGFNRPDKDGTAPILGWKDDVFWTLGTAADGPPAWYFGDGARPWSHPRNTRRLGAALFLLATAVLGFWFLKRARRARSA